MGVYESLTREELVRKLLAQENLCHELQGKVGKLQEEIFQQAKNGESEGENEGDVCENVVVKRTEKFLADNVVRLSLMLEAGNVFPWFADIVSGKIEIGDELFKAYGVDRKEFHDDFFRMTTFIASIYPDDRGIFEAIYNHTLADVDIKWKSGYCTCVVMASGGYPLSYPKGIEMFGMDENGQVDGAFIYHAGTKFVDDKFLTNGGRVLGVTCNALTLQGALDKSYEAVAKIKFENAHFRKDIGQRALKALYTDPLDLEYKEDMENYIEENGVYLRQ